MIKIGKSPMLAALAFALSVGIALGGCGSTPNSVPSAATQQRIDSAQTRVEHEALAVAYDREAADARGKAAEHRGMAVRYQTYPAGSGGRKISAHCNAIAGSYNGIATEYDRMAAGQRQLAGQARS